MSDSDSRASSPGASSPGASSIAPGASGVTPEGLPSSVLASHGKRLAAAALDGVFAFMVIVGGGVIGAIGGGAESWGDFGDFLLGFALGLLAGALIWLAMTARYVSRRGTHNGQTLGKEILGIHAVRSDLAPIGLGQAIAREFVSKGLLIGVLAIGLSTMIGFIDGGLVGILAAVIVFYGPAVADEQRRGLHDRIVGTHVIDVSPESASKRTTTR